MFKKAVIYYPTDEKMLKQIYKDIASFRCAAVAKYIETLNLNDRQIETLFDSLLNDIAARQQRSA